MAANLSPEYIKAEKEYRASKTPEEKLACLQRMLSVIPKHKGTEKIQADLKRKISQFKDVIEHQSKKKGLSYRVKPEGAGQIVLIGPPNSGKSSLLAAMTHAEPEIADYPFTTREPIPGMAVYQDIKIQMVDLPPVSREHCENFVFENIRGADGALLVIDLSAPDPIEEYQQTIQLLDEKKIQPVPPETPKEEEEMSIRRIRARLLLNKGDRDPTGEMASLVREMLGSPLPTRVISARERFGLETLAEEWFRLLHVIRVYSKQPGKPPDLEAPFTIPIGATVLDFAGHVHKDFAENLKYARIWGSAKFDGQVVHRDHVLQDRDIVELSI